MPEPKRKPGEDVKKYTNRLTEFYIEEGRKPDQAAAIAHNRTGTSRPAHPEKPRKHR
jgi:hypothetical protein